VDRDSIGISICLSLMLWGLISLVTPITHEIIEERHIKTNTHSFKLSGVIYKIRIDTAATDSMHNAWKVGK